MAAGPSPFPAARPDEPVRMNPFGRAEKYHAEEERRDHEYLKKQ